MSSTPPPGWYRDPSYPLTERWWDGTAWTDHRRQPGTPAPPMVPAEPPRRGGSRRARAIALTAAGVVLATAIVAGAVALGRDRGEAAPSTSSPAAGTSAPGGEEPSPSAATDPGVVVDHLNGVTFPVLDGWAAPDSFAEDDAVLITPGTYDCPGDPGLCRHGRVLSRTAAIGEDSSPQALAEGDIEAAAKSQFDRDGVGNRPHGGITSHQVVKTGQVAVAGRAGYFVRWRVITGKGPGGYVQSLAFPSSTGSQAPVIVRFAFDAGPDGPPLSDMDRITKGIRSVGDTATGGGVGSSIGPSH